VNATERNVVIPIDGLAEGETRLFPFQRDGQDLTGFVIRHAGGLAVYVNRCPHVPYSLDMGDGELMGPQRKFIQCMTHGAMFLPESGDCFLGPPVGRRLEPMPFAVEGDTLHITIPDEPSDWR
jgi:nitrite reductase/ring-hydroxylating ferredoxin subunit